MKDNTSTVSPRVMAFFLSLPLLFIGLNYWYSAEKNQSVVEHHRANGIPVNAVVLALHSKPGGRYRYIESFVEYSDQSGIKHQAILQHWSGRGFQVGSKLRVTYVPDDFTRVMIEGAIDARSPWRGKFITGMAICILSFGLFPIRIHKNNRIKLQAKQKSEAKSLFEQSREVFRNPSVKMAFPGWRTALNIVLIPIVLVFVVYAFNTKNFAHTTTAEVVRTVNEAGAREVIVEYIDDRLEKRQVPLLEPDELRSFRVGEKIKVDYGVGLRNVVKLNKPDPIPFLYWYLPLFLCVIILALNNRWSKKA